jgi:hypothetical protein
MTEVGYMEFKKGWTRFMRMKALLDDTTRYRSWVVHPYISDHAP